QLNLDEQNPVENPKLDQCISQLKADESAIESEIPKSPIQSPQQDLLKNYGRIDAVQLELADKLRELQGTIHKDIYELRDLLEQLFPKSDIRLLLKQLIEKGYIYWNGHEILYSHEMFLN